MESNLTKLNTELGRLIEEDGQPTRAIVNYLTEVIDELEGKECVSYQENLEKSKIDREMFIEFLKSSCSVMEDCLNYSEEN